MSPASRFHLADGHADSLMWNRDLTRRWKAGHLDFPRLQEAGTRIQCFTVVTRGFPFVDLFALFAALRRWPAEARRSPWTRCCFQLDWMDELCRRSGGAVKVTSSVAALEENIASGALSAVLGVEGGQALEGRPERVAELHRRGVRFMSLTHLSNNELGGSSSPLMGNRPLTSLGCEVLEAMVASGMLVDTAHTSPRTFADLQANPRARLFSSHTGVFGVTPSWRNLTDAQLRAIADRGGVAGIIFATVFLGGKRVSDVVRHIEHAVNVMGEDAVALGSDFDGMVPLPREMRDVTGTGLLLDALSARHPDSRVEKIAWGNWRRFFGETLGA